MADDSEEQASCSPASWCCSSRPRDSARIKLSQTSSGVAAVGGAARRGDGASTSRLAEAVRLMRSSSSASLSKSVLRQASDTIEHLRTLVGMDPSASGESELASWIDAEAALQRLQIAVHELARKERTFASARVDMTPMCSLERRHDGVTPATRPLPVSVESADAGDCSTAGDTVTPLSELSARAASASASCSAPAAAGSSAGGTSRCGSAAPAGRSLLATRRAWQGLPGGSSHALGDLVGRNSHSLAGGAEARGGKGSSAGIRILTIDGGSVRGLAVIEALRRLERVGGRPIADMFDLIVGTSIGGFLAILTGVRRSTMDECRDAMWRLRLSMHNAQGDGMFSGAKRLALGTAFDGQVHAEAMLDTLGAAARMDEVSGSPKVALVATCIDKSPAKPLLLRTYKLDEEAQARSAFEGTCDLTQLEAARATTAAPTFFPPTRVDGRLCVDGACIANNPALVALAEAATLWPDSHVEALISIGTGLSSEEPHPGTSLVDWLTFQVNASMDCHLAHAITASMLGRGHYFRINFPSVGDVALNETRIEVIEDMVVKAIEHLDTEEMAELIREAVEALGSKTPSECAP